MNENKGRQRWDVFIIILAWTILACRSVAGFNPFATATPTPTATFTPTPTFTAAPSPTATRTPTPTPRPSGVIIEEQSDGTSLVIDYDNKYQFLLPPNWAVVFSTQKELKQAIQSTSEKDPDFAEMAKNFEDLDPNVFRLAAINIGRDYVSANFPTVLTMNAYADPVGSNMPMEFVAAMIEDNILEGASSTTWDVIDNNNEVEVATVTGTKTVSAPDGSRVTVEELVIAFQANKKIIMIQIATPQKFAEQVLASFDSILDSIEVGIQ